MGDAVWMQAPKIFLQAASVAVLSRVEDMKETIMDIVMTRPRLSAGTSVPGCQIATDAYFPQSRLEGCGMGNDEDQLGAALKACAAGDRAGLAKIYQSEASRMVTVAQRILRRHDLAEEIVQEAFLQIWNKAWQYDASRGSARGWIFAVVRSRALNALRDGGREDLTETDSLERLQDEVADSVYEDLFDQLDTASRLRACLARLDGLRRRTVIMAYVSGYSHGEIAGRLKLPLGTAKAWIRRSLSALRECMA
jgi:RNA polymerase sigma-70 factor (ECF subfamily)